MLPPRKKFKPSPKRFHPKGLSIVFEDHDILVANKINGLLTVGTDKVSEKTAHFLLNEYVRKGNNKSRNRVFIVHRLDRDTSGLLVFAKTEDAKRHLQDNWQSFNKTYYTVVKGILPKKEGEIASYLAENKAYRMYSVDNPLLGKLAKTKYKVIKESESFSLLEIELVTGRKNQIRVHFADLGFPVVGDKFYGYRAPGIKRLMLHSANLTISHPYTKEEMSFKTPIPTELSMLLKN